MHSPHFSAKIGPCAVPVHDWPIALLPQRGMHVTVSMTDPSAVWPTGTRHLRIGDVRIDLCYRRVLRPDTEVELPHRMFELLLLFAAEPHVLHMRADLFRRVWPGVIVEDANLSQSVWMLRRALGHGRKGWIRTVAKNGYVFEPPTPVEVIHDLGPDPIEEDTPLSPGKPESAPVAPERSQTRIRRWPFNVAAAVCAVLLVGSVFFTAANKPSAALAPTPAPASVTLIEVDDPGVAAQARLPASLLHAWLEWKLSALPEVTVLPQAHVAADASAQASNVMVLLVSGPLPDDPTRIFLQARFENASGPHRIQMEGRPAEFATLVDTVSQRVMRELVPTRAQQPWPALKVDPATARRYVDLLRARQKRDWVETVKIGKELASRAPQFALARLHLAQALATLGQLPAAQEHMAAARSLLQPLPPDVAAVITAQQLALSPQHEATASAYAQLSTQHPAQAAFALQHARALGRTGRFADALALLSTPLWQRPQPIATQVSRLINRSGLQLALGDHAAARVSAREADRLAKVAGEGWEYERGFALLALAQADAYAAGGSRSSPFFEQAALHFESAGDTFSALRARFLGETVGPRTGPLVYLDAWLAQARAAGQRQLELSALRSAAFQHYRAGDIVQYRVRLRQAVAVADAMDDDWGHAALGTDLLNEDFSRGDFASVDRRLSRLERNGVQGELALWAKQFAALVAMDRGLYTEASAAVERGHKQAGAGRRESEAAPGAAGMFACTRAYLSLVEGKLEQARAQYVLCDAAAQGNGPFVQLGVAEIDLLSGDRDKAVRAMRGVRAQLPKVAIAPSRWGLIIDLAALLTRTGDTVAAAELYDDVLPLVKATQYRRLEAFARVGMAENAMARGDLSAAVSQVEAARPLLARDNWNPGYRLKLLDVAIARERGDLQSAENLLIASHHDAHRHGDVVAQALTHSWMSPLTSAVECSDTGRTALVARTGLRGATLEWLSPGGVALAAAPAAESLR